MKTCSTCGHPTSRGWAGGQPSYASICLVCWTVMIMKTCKYPKGKTNAR